MQRSIRMMGRVDSEICVPACAALLTYAEKTSKPAGEVTPAVEPKEVQAPDDFTLQLEQPLDFEQRPIPRATWGCRVR